MHKRILSMFLALVMLLSMVPFQALADGETETTAALVENAEPVTTEETVAVETTAAVETTQPAEETEAVETTVATEPAETVAETEPAETVEQTVAETIEETTPETVAAQSVAVIQEEELDALSVGSELQLTAVVLPEDVSDKTVVWTSSNETIATVDENGLVTGVAMGDVTITAACGEVSGTYDLTVMAAAVTVEVATAAAEPANEGIFSAVEPVAGTPDYLEVLAGKKLELEVEVVGLDEGEDATVVWSLPEEYSDYATVRADSKVSTKGILSVDPDISQAQTITVCAALQSDEKVFCTFQVTLIPKTSKLSLRVDGEEIPAGGYIFDLNDEELEDGVNVSAIAEPKDAKGEVTWKVSDPKGLCTATEIGGELLVVPGTSGKTGSITVTATATDDSGKYAKATIRFIRAAASLEILNAPEAMRSGTSVTLTTSVAKEPNLTDRNVVWSIVSGEDYATISSSGKLTTKNVGDEAQSVTVRAEAKANPSAYDEKTITICPAITSIVVSRDDGAENAPVEFTEGTVQLKADVQPEAVAGSVKWVSSNTKVATVDEDGTVTFVNAGKARISCEATDGTNKKGYFYLEVIKPVNDLTIREPASYDLISGKSLNLKATTWTVTDDIEAANQKISWSIWEETDSGELVKTSAAAISSSGRVSAKSVKVNTEVVVIAKSVEDDEVEDRITLTIMPSQERSLLLYMDDQPMADTVTLCSGEDYRIFGMCYDRNYGPVDVTEDCTFTSSKPSVVEIDEFGFVEAKASGTAVITARWTDPDTQRMYTTKVTLKVTNLVNDVEITQPKYDYVRGGSSVTLKATAWTNVSEGIKASNQKFTWKVFEMDDYRVPQETSVATISSGGRLTAKDVTETTTVYVYAYSNENEQMCNSIELTIRPRNAYQLNLSFGEETGTVTVARNLTDGDLSNLVTELYVSDSADVDDDGYETYETITWTTSNKKVIEIVDGEPVYPENGITGKVTLTAKVTYNKKTATAKITLNVVDAVEKVKVSTRVQNQHLHVGKYLYMKADCLTLDDEYATNRKVVWSIAEGDKAYASIDAKTGKLTAKKITDGPVTVTVIATPEDNSCSVIGTCEVTIYPMSTEVTITNSDVEDGKLEVLLEEETLTLEAYANSGCPEGVKWTSSKTSVASIDKDGVVTLNKRGTTTIRATAADGSGKSDSITLIVK